MTGSPTGMCKVVFELPDEVIARAPGMTEAMWAERTTTPYLLTVANIPFYVPGIAFGDTIRIRIDLVNREFLHEELVAESGNSTIQFTLADAARADEIGALLTEAGGEWESSGRHGFWAVNVPPATDYTPLRTQLLRLRDTGVIDMRESAIRPGHRPPRED
ncbi:DUF4265 domain-containing protein [Actinokineospora inagensis]|uniref:DUF4265 domain-containing protein n=1 Tax=Actinokineospora inagensis TaxID=103730 RepID=UPI000411520C|nr:DUF4265 domain-containing protein [Actinokineospora inagensis]